MRQEKDNINIAMLALSDELNLWCSEHGIEPQSADEIAAREDITPEQRKWLHRMIEAWDAVVDLDNSYYRDMAACNAYKQHPWPKVGDRIVLKEHAERGNGWVIPRGSYGTVTEVDEAAEVIYAKMDKHFADLVMDDGRLQWASLSYDKTERANALFHHEAIVIKQPAEEDLQPAI
jgi:hypothetical protein